MSNRIKNIKLFKTRERSLGNIKRHIILEEIREYEQISGHGVNFKKMTNKQLEKYLSVIKKSFEDYFDD